MSPENKGPLSGGTVIPVDFQRKNIPEPGGIDHEEQSVLCHAEDPEWQSKMEELHGYGWRDMAKVFQAVAVNWNQGLAVETEVNLHLDKLRNSRNFAKDNNIIGDRRSKELEGAE